MSTESVITLILGFFLAVLSTFATQKLQTWQVNRKNKKLSKKIQKTKKEFINVKRYAQDNEEYKEYLLMEIVKLIGIIVIAAIVAVIFTFGIIMVDKGASSLDRIFIEILRFFLFFSVILFLFLVLDKAMKIEIQHIRIKDFENYQDEVKKIIPEDEFNQL